MQVDLPSSLWPHLNDCFWPTLLKKSVRANNLVIDWLKRFFCTLLREIRDGER
jgi:hypothetical protein